MNKKGMNEMMNEMKMGVYTYNGESANFNFYTDLTASKKAVFVRTVVDTVVDGNNYDSVLRDIAFDYATISMFTDIDTSFLKVVDEKGNEVIDIDLIEEFILSTNVVEIIKVNAFPTLFDELEKAVNLNIEYRTGIHPSPIADSFSSLLSAIEKKINEVDLTNMTEMAQKLVGMAGDFTPESIVNAYLSSDIHKKNLEEIAEAKNSSKVE